MHFNSKNYFSLVNNEENILNNFYSRRKRKKYFKFYNENLKKNKMLKSLEERKSSYDFWNNNLQKELLNNVEVSFIDKKKLFTLKNEVFKKTNYTEYYKNTFSNFYTPLQNSLSCNVFVPKLKSDEKLTYEVERKKLKVKIKELLIDLEQEPNINENLHDQKFIILSRYMIFLNNLINNKKSPSPKLRKNLNNNYSSYDDNIKLYKSAFKTSVKVMIQSKNKANNKIEKIFKEIKPNKTFEKIIDQVYHRVIYISSKNISISEEFVVNLINKEIYGYLNDNVKIVEDSPNVNLNGTNQKFINLNTITNSDKSSRVSRVNSKLSINRNRNYILTPINENNDKDHEQEIDLKLCTGTFQDLNEKINKKLFNENTNKEILEKETVIKNILSFTDKIKKDYESETSKLNSFNNSYFEEIKSKKINIDENMKKEYDVTINDKTSWKNKSDIPIYKTNEIIKDNIYKDQEFMNDTDKYTKNDIQHENHNKATKSTLNNYSDNNKTNDFKRKKEKNTYLLINKNKQELTSPNIHLPKNKDLSNTLNNNDINKAINSNLEINNKKLNDKTKLHNIKEKSIRDSKSSNLFSEIKIVDKKNLGKLNTEKGSSNRKNTDKIFKENVKSKNRSNKRKNMEIFSDTNNIDENNEKIILNKMVKDLKINLKDKFEDDKIVNIEITKNPNHINSIIVGNDLDKKITPDNNIKPHLKKKKKKKKINMKNKNENIRIEINQSNYEHQKENGNKSKLKKELITDNVVNNNSIPVRQTKLIRYNSTGEKVKIKLNHKLPHKLRIKEIISNLSVKNEKYNYDSYYNYKPVNDVNLNTNNENMNEFIRVKRLSRNHDDIEPKIGLFDYQNIKEHIIKRSRSYTYLVDLKSDNIKGVIIEEKNSEMLSNEVNSNLIDVNKKKVESFNLNLNNKNQILNSLNSDRSSKILSKSNFKNNTQLHFKSLHDEENKSKSKNSEIIKENINNKKKKNLNEKEIYKLQADKSFPNKNNLIINPYMENHSNISNSNLNKNEMVYLLNMNQEIKYLMNDLNEEDQNKYIEFIEKLDSFNKFDSKNYIMELEYSLRNIKDEIEVFLT